MDSSDLWMITYKGQGKAYSREEAVKWIAENKKTIDTLIYRNSGVVLDGEGISLKDVNIPGVTITKVAVRGTTDIFYKVT